MGLLVKAGCTELVICPAAVTAWWNTGVLECWNTGILEERSAMVGFSTIPPFHHSSFERRNRLQPFFLGSSPSAWRRPITIGSVLNVWNSMSTIAHART